ncbi:MAG TPA: cytochrome P450 [Steroidobacteraceae bacterium]|nr:cytochrome P450 [Steroidobacteraceae bacterium]
MSGSDSAPSAARTPPEPQFSFDIGDAQDSLERMRELHASLGDIYRVYSPGRRRYAYVIHHPDDARRVLLANPGNYVKGFGLDRVKVLTGNGLVTSEGDFWRAQRYMMQPMFHRRVIARFAGIVAAANERLIERWERQAARGEAVNVTDDTSELTLEVILRAIFGEDLDRLSREPGGNPFQLIAREPVRDLSFAYRFRQLRARVSELAARRRASGSPEQPDFIGLLVAARDRASGAPMGERELVDEVMTLIIAGHETAASTLNSAWYLLSQHPQAETRLQAEIDALPEQPLPDLAATEALAYTRSVLSETLRLYPPVWLISRRTLGPDVLAGYPIPAGVDVLLSPYLIHRHPQFWSDPEQFRPERPELARDARRPQGAYIPFSAGPRHCVGESLAMFEMCVHLYKLVRRFRLRYEPGRPMPLEALINLRTRDPLLMRLERR